MFYERSTWLFQDALHLEYLGLDGIFETASTTAAAAELSREAEEEQVDPKAVL